MKARLVPAVGAALWLTAALPAFPQGADTFTETVDVELVNVDVWVSDSKGDPVPGLTAADFTVLHDGEPVPVTHFTEVRGSAEVPGSAGPEAAGEAGASGAGGPTAHFPGHVVVYFDQSRLHPRNYPALVSGLEDFLAVEGVEPERLLVLRQDQRLSVEAPFGSSRKELKEALARLGQGASSGLGLEAEEEQALEAIRDSWEQSQDSVGSALQGLSAVPGAGETPGGGGGAGGPRAVVGGVGSGAGPDACGMFVNQIQPILDGFTRSRSQRIAVTLANLYDAAGFVAGLPGVKTLLYLSDGLDLQPGAALASYASGLCPAGAADLLRGSLSEELSASFRELTRHANSNRVTIHALQASGLRTPGVASASRGRQARQGGGGRSRGAFESTQRVSQREGLRLIAGETGGRAVFNQNDLGPDLARIGRDLQTYYSLAYRPPAAADRAAERHRVERRREHAIEVRLADDSLTARYRRGYLEKDDDLWLAERIEGALNLGITANPLGVRLGAGDVRPGSEGTFVLPLHVMVPVEHLAFLPRDGAHVAEITVRAMARSLASGAVATRAQTYRVKGSPGAVGFANLVLELELGEGAQVTAVGVRDAASREASFVSTTLQLGPGG